MYVSCECRVLYRYRSLRRADPSSRVVLPSVCMIRCHKNSVHVQWVGKQRERLRKKERKKKGSQCVMGQPMPHHSECKRLDIALRGEFLWCAWCNILFGARFKSVRASLATWTRKMGQHREKSILGILGHLFSENAWLPYRVGLEWRSSMPTAPTAGVSSLTTWLPKLRQMIHRQS